MLCFETLLGLLRFHPMMLSESKMFSRIRALLTFKRPLLIRESKYKYKR